MYATTLSTSVSSSSSSSSSSQLRKTLSAVYARRSDSLRELARPRVRNGADAWDAVHDAFLFVLEHPPSDVSERALGAALDMAVRNGCNRQARERTDRVNLTIALRKRFPV